MVENIITSHTGIAYHVEHNAQGALRFQFSVECACVEHYPWVNCIR